MFSDPARAAAEGLRPVVVCLMPGSEPLAQRLAAACDGRADLRGRDFDDVSGHLAGLFLAGHPIVALAAAGIVIRALAPHLGDKWREPPVLAVAADGSAVVPLLGGHRGANALATRLGAALGIASVPTTAGEAAFGVALDAPPQGWRLETPADAKAAMAGLLAGRPATLSGTPDWLAPLAASGAVTATGTASDDPVVLNVEGAPPLVWRRQDLALGVGCARGCEPAELIGLVGRTLAEAGLSQTAVASVHSLDLKADEAAVHALARHLGVPARFHPADRLEAEAARLANPSDVVFAEVGCHGVAEAAALVASGPAARLLVEKARTTAATCAVARIGAGGEPGTPRGHLAIVGIGPGDASLRTPAASRAIAEAEELVGYGFYIDLLGPAARGKVRRDFALGEEEARCRHALESAGEGRRVALICSGDGGIYAMGALVMELLDRPAERGGVSPAARRVEVQHIPGISALQAASAGAGALLGHDFCAISLSDLLTPRDTILTRLRAAAEGDFVIAFYNPVSRRRRTLLAEAREILLARRPADTPVLLATSLGRPEQSFRLRRLDALDVEEVDMMTIVLIGSSASRRVASGDAAAGAGGEWLYTPRGYAKRIDGGAA
ncbi:precorrin-3B C(17)-methyltransferase [Tropicimonas sp. IMCC34043]|uniref:precorrin-3B C(17)-methyltransferase n=1 Tax=Tropicimonas sp. IMCC34043 TaxID=2248760 RepID=UPI000E21DE79|nr:precorrin-3B C(17)-methyltransferase [Tropicimonas sp. IMCC34043]